MGNYIKILTFMLRHYIVDIFDVHIVNCMHMKTENI